MAASRKCRPLDSRIMMVVERKDENVDKKGRNGAIQRDVFQAIRRGRTESRRRALDLVEFAKASKGPGTFAELENVIGRDPGRAGLA
jgi:hypothetical protein